MTRRLTWPDRLVAAVDGALRSLTSSTPPATRPSPCASMDEPALDAEARRTSIELMRVNHAGEVAAQALYSGQAVMARTAATRAHLVQAGLEEQDHLTWCRERLGELGGRPSLLVPGWYAGAFAIGLVAGAISDRVSLGFVAETEKQVEAHIQDHLNRLPATDQKSAAILQRMASDEAHHGTTAQLAGGAPLPGSIRSIMTLGGEILRTVAARV